LDCKQTITASSQYSDVIVIGAGAAGLLCAVECAEKGLNVTLLEKNKKPGMKILVSGGGRCNFTHLEAQAQHYISENPHFCKSALAKYRPEDFLQRLQTHQLTWVEKKKHQLFSAKGAKAILNCLIEDLKSWQTNCITECEVHQVDHDGKLFQLHTQKGSWSCEFLVIASGGLSWPKLGVSDIGYKIARQFEHQLTKRSPGLVPLLWDDKDLKSYQHLAGLATSASLEHGGQHFTDDLLFTHQGLSGPLILQISSYWEKGQCLTLEWCNIVELQKFFESNSDLTLNQYLQPLHPKRWIKAFLSKEVVQKKPAQLSHSEKETLLDQLCRWKFQPKDHAGFGKAEVTLGGVSTNRVSSKSMESQIRAKMYFIGEVLDVTGQLGGFNFQWAWSSAAAAARHIAGF
jgi:predicted Rossmann fold flavoprotein